MKALGAWTKRRRTVVQGSCWMSAFSANDIEMSGMQAAQQQLCDRYPDPRSGSEQIRRIPSTSTSQINPSQPQQRQSQHTHPFQQARPRITPAVRDVAAPTTEQEARDDRAQNRLPIVPVCSDSRIPRSLYTRTDATSAPAGRPLGGDQPMTGTR